VWKIILCLCLFVPLVSKLGIILNKSISDGMLKKRVGFSCFGHIILC
jgi:hypothetical protein